MSQTYKVFYFEDDNETAQPIKEFLENPVQDPALKVIHYADAGHAKDTDPY